MSACDSRAFTCDTKTFSGPGPGPAPTPELRARRFRETWCWTCTVLADRRYVPAAGAGDMSTVRSADPFPTVQPSRTFLRELGATTPWRLSARRVLNPQQIHRVQTTRITSTRHLSTCIRSNTSIRQSTISRQSSNTRRSRPRHRKPQHQTHQHPRMNVQEMTHECKRDVQHQTPLPDAIQ